MCTHRHTCMHVMKFRDVNIYIGIYVVLWVFDHFLHAQNYTYIWIYVATYITKFAFFFTCILSSCFHSLSSVYSLDCELYCISAHKLPVYADAYIAVNSLCNKPISCGVRRVDVPRKRKEINSTFLFSQYYYYYFTFQPYCLFSFVF